jgi:ABC-type hemin transport system ATPase subunit
VAAPTPSVEGLSLRRNGRAVLDGVTFEAANGEVVALIERRHSAVTARARAPAPDRRP